MMIHANWGDEPTATAHLYCNKEKTEWFTSLDLSNYPSLSITLTSAWYKDKENAVLEMVTILEEALASAKELIND